MSKQLLVRNVPNRKKSSKWIEDERQQRQRMGSTGGSCSPLSCKEQRLTRADSASVTFEQLPQG